MTTISEWWYSSAVLVYDFETTLGKDTKDPTTHWDSERIGHED